MLEPIPVMLGVVMVKTTLSCVRPVKEVQNNHLRTVVLNIFGGTEPH